METTALITSIVSSFVAVAVTLTGESHCFSPNNTTGLSLFKKRTNRWDTGLIGVSDEEIQKKARDKNLSGSERNRYREEEKVRGLRNKQKRGNKNSINMNTSLISQVFNGALGVGLVLCGGMSVVYIFANDVTLAGIADDWLAVPSLELINRGIELVCSGR